MTSSSRDCPRPSRRAGEADRRPPEDRPEARAVKGRRAVWSTVNGSGLEETCTMAMRLYWVVLLSWGCLGTPIEFVGCTMQITREEWLRRDKRDEP